ncbi:MAG: DUF1848 family protein [Candidatus Magnetomorum sp.]|nr:DUF1848 family protein [Candidatus Magnetomorum sp.]
MKSSQKNKQIILSASRRTDIPAFYMDWFMSGLQKGLFNIHHPFHRKKMIIPATPEHIHSIVFWSKNYGPFIQGGYADRLQSMGYHFYFHFTINTPSEILEPGVPSLEDRLNQLRSLCSLAGPEVINWRFDPICRYQTLDHHGKLTIFDNLNGLDNIARTVSDVGIKRCVISFMDDYRKIHTRLKQLPYFQFIKFTIKEQVEIILCIENKLKEYGLQLFVCCEKDLLNALPQTSGIKANSCIPGDFLMKHYGGQLTVKKDYGQRIKQGCECSASRDIGDYVCHPCLHQCLYCYANNVRVKSGITPQPPPQIRT